MLHNVINLVGWQKLVKSFFLLFIFLFFFNAGGRIFLIDGAGARGTATAKSATYGATKAAMPQLMRSLAAEAKQSKVSLHLASPGMVATGLLLHGVSNPRAAKIVNILAEDSGVVAKWLVPRMRGVTGNGKYFK